jgi:integrase/recombinase XerD
VNKNIENVRQFLEHLITQAYVQRGFLDALQLVKEPSLLPTSVLTHAQVKTLITRIPTDNPCGYRDRAMVELLNSTGIRINEMLTLKISDVNFENATAIVNGKGNKQRVVPIGKTALRYLRTYLVAVRPYVCYDMTNPILFLSRNDKQVNYQAFLKMIHAYTKTAGLDINVTPHTFRRSCTTELKRGGANMYHVKELLGHENLDTLRHYVKLTITDLKKTHEKCHPREKDGEASSS